MTSYLRTEATSRCSKSKTTTHVSGTYNSSGTSKIIRPVIHIVTNPTIPRR